MNEKTQIFPYTAHRKGYLVTVAAFGFSICVEIALLTLVIVAVVHNDFVRAILLLAHTGLSLVVIMMLLQPLWTKHRLTEAQFEVRYGSLHLIVPRDAIHSVKAVRELLTPFQSMKAQVDTKTHRLIAAFSVEGQVLLTLERPLTVRIDRKTLRINSVLINVNEPDRLLVALNMKQTPLSVGQRCIAGDQGYEHDTEAYRAIQPGTPGVCRHGVCVVEGAGDDSVA